MTSLDSAIRARDADALLARSSRRGASRRQVECADSKGALTSVARFAPGWLDDFFALELLTL